MPFVYRNGALAADTWAQLGADDALPADGEAVLPLARWLALATDAERARFGISTTATEVGEPRLASLTSAPLIVLTLPSFTDGRVYSLARLLREAHGYTGELRAAGDVLLDQIPLLARCGFDSFLVTHSPTLEALQRGHLAALTTSYQRSFGDASTSLRPTLQRAPRQESAA